jgi:predicted Zn-dependent protease
MKQTAVEWLADNLHYLHSTKWDDILEQAKEMQKEQHANTWDDSRVEDRGDNYVGKQKSFNDYYEETYEGNK